MWILNCLALNKIRYINCHALKVCWHKQNSMLSMDTQSIC